MYSWRMVCPTQSYVDPLPLCYHRGQCLQPESSKQGTDCKQLYGYVGEFSNTHKCCDPAAIIVDDFCRLPCEFPTSPSPTPGPTSKPTPAPTTAPPPPPSDNCIWDECTDSGTCAAGLECKEQNPYYSQCLEPDDVLNKQGCAQHDGLVGPGHHDSCCNPDAVVVDHICKLPCELDSANQHQDGTRRLRGG